MTEHFECFIQSGLYLRGWSSKTPIIYRRAFASFQQSQRELDSQTTKTISKTGNGKGVVVATMTALLGTENVNSVALEQFSERFALAPTIGKLVNFVHEMDRPSDLAEGTIKAFVAGDRLTIDRKYCDPIAVLPTARLVITTNEWPSFKDQSDGIQRRLIPLRFPVQIAQERMDPQLAERLTVELPGIFNWALQGLRRLNSDDCFSVPEASKVLLDELKPEPDSATAFLKNRCRENAAGRVITRELYGIYCVAGSGGGRPILSNAQFGSALIRMFPKAVPFREPTGHRKRGYKGIELTAVERQ